MKEESNQSNKIKQLLKGLPTYITITYISLSIIGAIYMWTLFREFGINIFTFIEMKDLFLFAFSSPWILFVTIPASLLYYYYFVIYYKKKRGKPFIGAAMLAIILSTIVFPRLLARYYVVDLKDGHLSKVDVYLSKDAKNTVNLLSNVSIIGSAGNFIVFFDNEKNTAYTINKSAVREIRIENASRLISKAIEHKKASIKPSKANSADAKNRAAD